MRRTGIGPLLLALVFASCAPSISAVSPSPTATPTPTLEPTTPVPTRSPSPTPTVRPTTPRPNTAQPTISYDAGQRLLPFYFDIRKTFTLFPPAPVILPDETNVDENAVFRGLDPQGQPMFAVRHDFVMDLGTAGHEMGHAYQKLLERKNPSKDYLALYWRFRGFPGTWQQAQAQSDAQTDPNARWQWSPQESWAEAFRAAVTLEVKEKTLDYGKTIDPQAARDFFISLVNLPPS